MVNLSLYTVPAAWVLCIAPHIYSVQLFQNATSKFDNKQPRFLVQSVVESQNIDVATKGRILRADFAQHNGFENLGFFAAAVVAGNMAKLDLFWLNGLTVGYVLSRILYDLIYIHNTTESLAATRSAVYMLGVADILTLFTMAANALRS